MAWRGLDYAPPPDTGWTGVFARKLVNSGQSTGSQVRVNALTPGFQSRYGGLDIAADDAGNFVVVFVDANVEAAPPSGGVVFRRFDANKNPLGSQVVVSSPGGEDPKIAGMPDGRFMIVWQNADDLAGRVYDATGLPVTATFEVAADADYPAMAASEDYFFVAYEVAGPSPGRIPHPVVRTFDTDGSPASAALSMSDGRLPDVAAGPSGKLVVAWEGRQRELRAQRFQVTTPSAQDVPLVGKVLILTNKAPDDFEKSKGAWKASGDAIVSPLRGSASDPRCNGDPVGTVKATVRFRSADSGQDVTYGLPCQNWSATGSDKVGSIEKRGYKYGDGKRQDGPCNSVKIKGTKSLSVSCKGKPGAAEFAFDLVAGVGQGAITTVLEMGQIKHCAEFQPLFDGSDGKKYKGKALSSPAACP